MPLNEGQTVQYTVTTTNTADGTVLYWRTTGNTTNSDIVGGNTGSITITNNRATFNVTTSADVTTDDTKTLGISISTGSLNGPTVVSTANPIIVNDTSQSPAYKLYAIGAGSVGRTGLNDDVIRSSPTQVGTDTNWNEIAFGGQSVLATKTNGTLWCWGDNNNGQLGLNDLVNRSSPVQIGSLTNWSKIALGQYHAAATRTDGTLWAWGNNGAGQLGMNNVIYRSSPVQIGVATSWTNVVAGSYNLFAVSNSYLYSWGQNQWGQLGHNDRVYKSSPVQVGQIAWWNGSITAGQDTTFAVGVGGGGTQFTLYGWGYNGEGYLGLSDRVSRSSPTQVGSMNDYKTISFSGGGNAHSLATTPDGRLYGWGSNNYGQLGLNSVSAAYLNRSYPVQISSSTDWAKVATGSFGDSFAIKTDGTLWHWGRNLFGQSGLNNTVSRSSPTQVGTATNWNKIAVGPFTTILTTSS